MGIDESVNVVSGVPFYTYILTKRESIASEIKVEGYRFLCAYTDGSGNNVVKMTGILQHIDSNRLTPYLQTQCLRWPTYWEQLATSAQRAATHGCLRGLGNVVEHTMVQHQYSQHTAKRVNKLVSYGLFFLWQWQQEYQMVMELSQPEFVKLSQSAMTAGYKTGYLLLINVSLGLASNMLQRTGNYLTQKGWSCSGTSCHLASKGIKFGVFAQQASTQGVTNTVVAIGAGAVAETAVTSIGKPIADRLFALPLVTSTPDDDKALIEPEDQRSFAQKALCTLY